MSRRKAISAIVAVVLLLMMTVAAAGFAYVFMGGLASSAEKTTDSSLKKTASEISKCIAIDSVYANKVYVRNCGQGVLKQADLKLFVNGQPTTYGASFTEIAQGDTKALDVSFPTVSESNKIEIKGSQGGSISQVVKKQNLEKDLNSDSALVGYWKFDEGTGTTAKDSSGKGNTGTLYDGTTVCSGGTCPTWDAGKIGKALKFDGTGDYVNVPYSASLSFTNSFTISFWMYRSEIRNGGLIERWNDIGIRENNVNNKLNAYFDNTGSVPSSSSIDSSALSLNAWKYVSYAWDGSSQKIYINGLLDGDPVSKGGTFEVSATVLRIGQTPGYDYFKGLIDDVRIYNRALTADEIATLYAMGNAG